MITKPLTQPQSVSWELPFTAVIGKTVTLLIKRHFLWIHYNWQVSCFNICGIRLKIGKNYSQCLLCNSNGRELSFIRWKTSWGVPCIAVLALKFILNHKSIPSVSCLSFLLIWEINVYACLSLISVGQSLGLMLINTLRTQNLLLSYGCILSKTEFFLCNCLSASLVRLSFRYWILWN